MATSWTACRRIRDVGPVPASAAKNATVFRWTVPLMVLALVLALAMPEKALAEEMIEVAQGKAEVPEH